MERQAALPDDPLHVRDRAKGSPFHPSLWPSQHEWHSYEWASWQFAHFKMRSHGIRQRHLGAWDAAGIPDFPAQGKPDLSSAHCGPSQDMLLRNHSSALSNWERNIPNHHRTQLTSELQLALGFLFKLHLNGGKTSFRTWLSPLLKAFSSPKPCFITVCGISLLVRNNRGIWRNEHEARYPAEQLCRVARIWGA